MTNERAKEVLQEQIDRYGQEYDAEGIEALEIAINVLEQTRWISCFDRLPEDYVHVLCQFTLGGMGECYLAHGMFHVVGGLVMTCNEVIAWMPLPPNYQAESKEMHCNHTDAEIAKSFVEDVEAVKNLLPRAESEDAE